MPQNIILAQTNNSVESNFGLEKNALESHFRPDYNAVECDFGYTAAENSFGLDLKPENIILA